MSIKGLSEDVRMPRLGKIHLGIKDPQRGFPVKTDYFVFPKEHSDYEKLVKLFGDKPKELRIYIPVEDEEQWASQYYKSHQLSYGLVCKGDGESALRMVDSKTGELPTKETGPVIMKELACAGKDCPVYKAKKCKEVMNLRFILPEVPGIGVWQIDTGSINSILNINSCAKIIKKAFGRISMIPLKLTLEPYQVNSPENGKKQTVYVLNLRSDVTLAQLADAAREQAKTFMLEAPDMEEAYEEENKKIIDELWGDGKPPSNPPDPPSDAVTMKNTPSNEQVKEKGQAEAGKQEEKPKRDPSTIKNFGELYDACAEDWPGEFKIKDGKKIDTRKAVWKEANVKSQEDISELPSVIYQRIAAVRQK